ncbi:hypothetical protein [Prochlorococcus marinus]|uniref:hypothetical protein n=1 Tax=Prochlorococcus marinus TaxID=1219 RepID=UPI00094D96D6|nr:hypothetical protein [Prochlorococcus marinus]
MKYFTFIIIFIQINFFLKSFSESIRGLGEKSLKWEIIEENKSNNQTNQIKWEVLPKEKKSINLEGKSKKGNFKKNHNSSLIKTTINNIYEISPIIPSNNLVQDNEIQTSVEWKSSFGGGKSGGTGQQNNSFKIDYGLTDFSQISGYFAEADDSTYNYINGKSAEYAFQTYALSLKQKIWSWEKLDSSLSVVSAIEYFKISSGSTKTKSIFNESNDFFDKDKFGKIIYSFSLPYEKKFTKNLTYSLVPGFIFLPKKLGDRTTRDNFYGNNFFIGNGITFNLLEDLTLHGSLTYPLGPGNNHFDKNLNFSKKPIYSFGFNLDLNEKIGIQTKITNSFGSTPSTGILTLPSKNLPLYTANIKYIPYGEDNPLRPLNKRDKQVSFGGITVNNALIQDNGTSQYVLDIDSEGSYFGSYRYSLSNIFQLELINLGSMNKVKENIHINKKFTDTYIDENNFNLRIGGKFLLFSPQKNDFLWTSFRTSLGRNESTNQGYILSEIINTYRINSWLASNISSKYFLSGSEKFGSIGASIYWNISDNLQIIPEINYLLDKNLNSNNTISIRYSFNDKKSMDLYASNALGTQDLGQLLRAKETRIGIKLNLIY